MSYPPQQPWGQGGHGGQPPQQWGGQPQQPQWGGQQGPQWQGQQGQSWGGQGGQQWQGQQPPQGQWSGQQGQQWGGQQGQQQWAGQGGPQWQQYPGAPSPSGGGKGKVWLIVGAGVLLVAVIVVVVVMMLGGGDYAGDERPPLPESVDGWTKGEGMFGESYTKDGQEVLVTTVDNLDEEADPSIAPPEGQPVPDVDVEESKPAKGVQCGKAESQGTTFVGCVIRYKDGTGFSVFSFEGGDGVEDFAVALSKE